VIDEWNIKKSEKYRKAALPMVSGNGNVKGNRLKNFF
jgi:hypothetical protein